MSRISDEMERALAEAGYSADAQLLERFEAFHALLTSCNSRMDLTNVPEAEIPRRHYLDSILPVLSCPGLIAPDASVVDIGSGAGFPGIPLAILLPGQPITLLEANGRRCAFLREAAERLQLTRVTVVEARAEDAGRNSLYRERFDVTLSRAVAALPELLEYMLPLTGVGGCALCWKGRKADEERVQALTAIRTLGGGTPEILPYGMADEGGALVRVPKAAATPPAYPRRAGIPHKRPLQ